MAMVPRWGMVATRRCRGQGAREEEGVSVQQRLLSVVVVAGSGGAAVPSGPTGEWHGALDPLPWSANLVLQSSDLLVRLGWRRQLRAAAWWTAVGEVGALLQHPCSFLLSSVVLVVRWQRSVSGSPADGLAPPWWWGQGDLVL